MARAKVTYICELPNGKYRFSTVAEIDAAKKLQKRREAHARQAAKLAALLKDCKHEVCVDKEGFIYNERHCVACGHVSIL